MLEDAREKRADIEDRVVQHIAERRAEPIAFQEVFAQRQRRQQRTDHERHDRHADGKRRPEPQEPRSQETAEIDRDYQELMPKT